MGSDLAGRFRLVEAWRAGGMATIGRARDLDAGGEVAVKVLASGGSLETARLVGFDYFQPDPTPENSMQPDPILGTEFVYNPGFDGWMAHIYLWSDNPEGMFENWNAKVPLCTAE